MSTPLSRIPVLLLTGFLGSGKTTLLNRLMSARPDSRGKLAIVVNELGDVGVDGDLLPRGLTRQVELPGGCICCVLNEDLDKTLLELIQTTPDIELVIIETTGVAEPLPITWSLDREPASRSFRLAAVITVVDITLFESSRPLSPAVDAQVEHADVLVLSKLDLVGGGEVPAGLAEVLRGLNDGAVRLPGDAGALWRIVADPMSPDWAGAPRSSNHAHAPHAAHVAGFDSVSLPIHDTIDFEELSEKLEELPANYVRIKGIARAIDRSTGSAEPRWIAFHRVGTRVSSEPLGSPAAMRMVALGPGIERSRLAACLDAAVVRCKS